MCGVLHDLGCSMCCMHWHARGAAHGLLTARASLLATQQRGKRARGEQRVALVQRKLPVVCYRCLVMLLALGFC